VSNLNKSFAIPSPLNYVISNNFQLSRPLALGTNLFDHLFRTDNFKSVNVWTFKSQGSG